MKRKSENDSTFIVEEKHAQKSKKKRKAAAHDRSSSDSYEVTDEEHDTAVRLLREVNWAKCQNTSRRNVIRVGDPKTPKNAVGKEYCHSFIFGKNMKDSTGGLSYWSVEYPELYAFFQALINRVHPEHSYTNITVNKNLVCKKHTDGGNTGRSYIIAFGKFTGGRLIIEKKGGGDPRPVDIFRKFVPFEGSTQPHETEAFEGERYSAVFYTSNIVPTEIVPRHRPATILTTTSDVTEGTGVRSETGGKTHEAGGVRNGGVSAGSQGSSALQQKFQAMKKKLQGKVAR